MDDIRICTLIPPGDNSSHESAQFPGRHNRLALEKRYFWKAGETIHVHLLGGSPYVRKMVKKYARVWLEYANLKFKFTKRPDAEIRVSFVIGDGSWSMLGTDCRNRKGTPTMNFGWLYDNTPEEEFSRTVTHEFGHALGCIHEHLSPAGNIQWNKEAAYQYYGRQNNWSRDQVAMNIFNTYSVSQTQFTSFDRSSIMLYQIPAQLTTNGYSTPNNTRLSQQDKSFIAKMYPYSKNARNRHLSTENEDDSDGDSDSGNNSEAERLTALEAAIEGRWRGHYYYQNGSTDGETIFNLSTSPIQGQKDALSIEGSGHDGPGSFTVKGRADSSGRISFTKNYPGYAWDYSGKLDQNQREMKGNWGGTSGTFRFNRK